MPTFEITEVESEFNTWTAKKGPAAGQEFRSYKIRARGPDGEERDFEINRKPNSGPPPLGAVEAEVQPSNGNFPAKLKLTPQGRSGGSSGAKDDYWQKKEQRDVESQARMGRAHAQEMSLRYFALLSQDNGPGSLDALPESWLETKLRPMINWFHQDVQRFPDADVGGGGESKGGQPPVAPIGGPAVSAEPARATADVNAERVGFASDKQRDFFERLLKDAGLTSQQVAEINRYVTEALATDRVSKAIDAIKEGDRDKAIEALLQQSLEWHKKQTDLPWEDDQSLPPVRSTA